MKFFSHYEFPLLVCGNDNDMMRGGPSSIFGSSIGKRTDSLQSPENIPYYMSQATNLDESLWKKGNGRNHVSSVGFGEAGKACLFLWTQRPIKLGKYCGEMYPVRRDFKLNKAVLEISQSPTIKWQGRLNSPLNNFTLEKKISNLKCSIILTTSTQTASRSNSNSILFKCVAVY